MSTLESAPPTVISRQRNPDNLEFPFSSLDRFITPQEQFYVRSHFTVPELSAASWLLSIEGAVERPCSITYSELRAMPSCTRTALLECSGNSRIFLDAPQPSIRWELGGVSNAEWTGVKLSVVLERAGIKPNAVEVICEGADEGEVERPDPETPGIISYARSLPLQKAQQPEVLLAYQMNGEDLTRNHGFPVRLVVPGWYGMASVKWLKRLIVTERPFCGYFQSFLYAVWQRTFGLPSLVAIADIPVKSEIARPAHGEVLRAGEDYRIFGAAWAGEADVTRLEVSTDGGHVWNEALLLGTSVQFAWRLWEYDWQTPGPGRHTLMARATDSRGNIQPMLRDNDHRDAVVTHVLPVEVNVL